MKLIKIKMYLLSLWVLFILIIIQTIDFTYQGNNQFIGFFKIFLNNLTSILCIIFLFIGYIIYKEFKFKIKGSSIKHEMKKIRRLENLSNDYISFLATTIIPVMSFDLNDIRQIISLIIILVVIGIIYIKTDKFYANPTLAILGFKIYKVDFEDSSYSIVITDKLLNEDKFIELKLISNGINFGRFKYDKE